MLKKTMTYETFDGRQVTEDFYFNLTEAEVIEMELSAPGNSYRDQLQTIVNSQDGKVIIEAFKSFIKDSVGQKTPDGKGFMKSPEITAAFLATNAYSDLFMELATDAEAGAVFINGIMPAKVGKVIHETAKSKGISIHELTPEDIDIPPAPTSPAVPEDTRPAYIREDRDPTPAELQAMNKDEIAEAMRRLQAKRVYTPPL